LDVVWTESRFGLDCFCNYSMGDSLSRRMWSLWSQMYSGGQILSAMWTPLRDWKERKRPHMISAFTASR
jgi:hypothetical protein